MEDYNAEVFKEITGEYPSKPFAERTPEERIRARDEFIASLKESDMDDAVDELFARARLAFRSAHDSDADAA